MNRLTKTVLITSLALFISGIICMGAGYALNGSYEAADSGFHLNINGKEYGKKNNKNNGKNKARDKDSSNSKGRNYGDNYGNGGYGYDNRDDIKDFFRSFGMSDDAFNKFFGDSGSYYEGDDESSSSEGGNNSSSGRIYYY